MSAEKLLQRLDKVKQTRAGSWIACCPAHEDKTPSLSITESSDGWVGVHCFAGCPVFEVCAAVGIELHDLFPPRPLETMPDRTRPLSRPINPADALACLAEESLIAAVAASNLAQGMTLTDADRDRLWKAANRLEEGARLANGER